MRLGLALVLGLLVATTCGCWLAHGPDGGGPAADGDADADTDADADADADADGDADTGQRVRPTQVCGLRHLSRLSAGTLRVLTLDCAFISDCSAVVVDGALDLRPVNRTANQPDGEAPPEGACFPFTWFDCEVPPGDYHRLTVWGEALYVPCFGGDLGDCEAPDCVQLPWEPLPEDCVFEPFLAEQVCGPSSIEPSAVAGYSVVNTCGCVADWRPAGCLVSTQEIGPVFQPLAARCSECQPEPMCVAQETTCSIYDPPVDRAELSLVFPSWSEPIAFDVPLGGWGVTVCEPE